MTKIAIDARELRTSTGRYIERLLHYLQSIDTEHDYYVLLYPKDMAGWQPTNRRFTKVACPYKEYTFAEQLGFAWQLYRLKVDLVHFGMTHQPLLYLKRSVTTIHDLTTVRFYNPDKNPIIFWLKQQVYKIVIWYAAHKSQRLITPSRFVAQDIAAYAHLNRSKISVTYESADAITEIAAPMPAVGGKRFLLYLGRPTPHKNLWRLVKAFEILKQQYPDLHLVLAGKKDNNYQRIAHKIQSEQITNIIFTDFVCEGQLRWLYENCAAYVFPSLSEGFGLPAMEALYCGAPVVSSNATCLPEIYGDAVLYFDPLDIQQMARQIASVLKNPQLAADLRARGYQLIKQYSWQRMAAQTLAVYQAALNEKPLP